jgi:hypothetical protein
MFHINNEEINMIDKLLPNPCRGKGAGFDSPMYLFFTKAVKEGYGKICLKEYFAARKGNAAPGLLVERAILEAGFHDLIHRVVTYSSGVKTNRPKTCFLGLRIGAPETAERAALKKDYRTDAGAVMYAEFLNVKK